MDPQRSDMRPLETLTGAERDARIEQLLLSGLDEYFNGRYDQAINLWTRVLFLDRHHDRARAYIERARSAQAEKQRESEALLHQGMEAFQHGNVDRARALVATALEQGAPRDLALGVLDRIDRLGAPVAPPARRTPRRGSRPDAPPPSAPAPVAHRQRWAIATLLLVAAATGAALVGLWGAATSPDLGALRLFNAAVPERATALAVTSPDPLPVPAATEAYLSRAQSLFASGRLRDALTELDRIPLGDPLHGDAETLRGRIQRELLAIATAERAPAVTPPPVQQPPE